MPDLTFIPLSVLADDPHDAARAVGQRPAIVFGREAVFLDDVASATAKLPTLRRALHSDRVLAAVVQKGRLFQQAYPDVTVLRDRGRFLLVEIDPGHPALAGVRKEPCFAVYRVEPGTEVFREARPGDMRVARDPAIASVVSGVSIATFRSSIEELVALHTRLSTTAFYRQAADLCKGRFEAFGYSVSLQEFDMPGGRSCNVVAVPSGAKRLGALVMGHLDSVNHAGGDGARAPGADDNASGSAGVIAMAEALVPVRDRLPIGFVLFGGEEQGLLGSQHLLAGLSSEQRAALRAIINMDMIGTLNTLPDGTVVPPGVLLEGAEVSRSVVEGLAAQAATWTDLAVQTSFNPFASDHVPFIHAGLPAVLTIEGADQANSEVHGPGDTLDRIDDALAYRILRMNTAYVASLATSASARAARDQQPKLEEKHMGRSCASVQNFFRTIDQYPAHRTNLAALEGLTRTARLRSASLRAAFPRKIPVVVHVIHTGGSDNISNEQVASQIDVLNEDFNNKNVDLKKVPDEFKPFVGNAGIEFFLAKTDPGGGSTNGITRTKTTVTSFGADDRMKSDATGGKSPWDTTRYLNIWVCTLSGGLLGYAQFPGGNPTTDGVVVTTRAFGRGKAFDLMPEFNLGRTGSHEVGHYLNLFHIWGNDIVANCTDSDLVGDTPNQFGPNLGTPTFPSHSCGNTPNGDMFMNYMDYVDDVAMFMFTNDQVARMHAALEFSRSGLGKPAAAGAVAAAPALVVAG